METNPRLADEDLTGCDLARNVGGGVPVAIDEEEPTLAIPAESNRQVVDGRLR